MDTALSAVSDAVVIATGVCAAAVIAVDVDVAAVANATAAGLVVNLPSWDESHTIFFQICMTNTALRTENMTDTPGTEQYDCIRCAIVVMTTAALNGSSVCTTGSGFVMTCHG